MNRKRFNTEFEKTMLNEVVTDYQNGNTSLRKGCARLEEKTGQKITPEGLRKIINKAKERTHGFNSALGFTS